MTSKSPTETALCYLKDHNLTVVTAESCTAGLVASTFAEMPGCGSCLDSAFVVYSPESKMQLLGIDRKVLEKNNLTSEPVARAMSESALRRSGANVAISNTGVAGPGHGEGEIPPGTVCFAWSFDRGGWVETFSETKKFQGGRNEVRKQAAEFAVQSVVKYHGMAQGGKQRAKTTTSSKPDL